MSGEAKTKRINVSLSRDTITIIDRVWRQKKFRSRSAFLDEAARHYALRLQGSSLKRQLREGYNVRSQENLALLAQWDAASGELVNAEETTFKFSSFISIEHGLNRSNGFSPISHALFYHYLCSSAQSVKSVFYSLCPACRTFLARSVTPRLSKYANNGMACLRVVPVLSLKSATLVSKINFLFRVKKLRLFTCLF